MCDRIDCERPAVYAVGFSFSAVGVTSAHGRAKGWSGLRVCAPHGQEATIENTFGSQLIDIARQLCRAKGLRDPDPTSFEIVLHPLN